MVALWVLCFRATVSTSDNSTVKPFCLDEHPFFAGQLVIGSSGLIFPLGTARLA
jgi:hypothetical protein